MKKLNLSRNEKSYDFYQVLKVLYYFVDEESKEDKGEILRKMNSTKKLIIQLAADLGNIALLNDWYNISKIKKSKLKSLVDYDEDAGYSPKNLN